MSSEIIICQNKNCNKVFDNYEDNFYKKKSSKTGYDIYCKSCNKTMNKLWYNSQSEQKKEELRLKNIEVKKQARQENRYKKTVDNYKEKRKVLRNTKSKFDKIAEKIANYEKKFNWQETPYHYIPKIKKEEY